MKEKDVIPAHQDLRPIALPEPRRDGGKTVLASLWERKTIRNMREDRLPPKEPLTAAIFPCFGVVEAGFIGQNVYLFCASEGLATWFYATDREGLAKAMNLRPPQKVLYCQAVGCPG
jgi:hypothetical protein